MISTFCGFIIGVICFTLGAIFGIVILACCTMGRVADEREALEDAGVLFPSVVTNADRIRSMTDEELATWMNCMQSNAYHCGEFGRTNAAYPFDNKAWNDWLKSPVKDGE